MQQSRPFRQVLQHWKRASSLRTALEIKPEWRSEVPRDAKNVMWLRPKGAPHTAYAMFTHTVKGASGQWVMKFSTMSKKRHNLAEYRFFFKSSDREKWIRRQIENDTKAAQAREQARADRKSQSVPFSVGDILVASWGYDQTNTDFAKVIGVKGSVIKIVPIGKTTGGNDRVLPDPSKIIGEVMMRRPSGQYVRGDSASVRYRKWDGTPQYQTNSLEGH